jgi:transcriptional regulator of arginine metabolism
MSNKRERQEAIRQIVESRAVGSQEELRRLLRQRGWDVTQSTLSRDLRELRLARVPTDSGVRYTLTDTGSEEHRMMLDTLLPQLYNGVDGVGELLVLHTLRGGAPTIAEAIDEEDWPDVVGTIAGDDTILLICRSAAARERLTRRIRSLAGEVKE